jgi:hypothetical protein
MTSATPDQLQRLSAATPPEEIGTLKGRKNNKAGTTSPDMSYVTARFAAERLDSAVGPGLWQIDFRRDGTNRLYVGVGIWMGEIIGWVWKWDTGEESSIEAGKGEFSDAFKRSCVQWGIGRDLYPSPNKQTARDNPAASAKPKRKAKPKPEPEEDRDPSPGPDPEADVVGSTGLTRKQKALMFASLRDAGVPDEKRKKLVHTICGKWSTKDMDSSDLDTVLAFTKDGEYSEEDE